MQFSKYLLQFKSTGKILLQVGIFEKEYHSKSNRFHTVKKVIFVTTLKRDYKSKHHDQMW
jgi:hypothetical protein